MEELLELALQQASSAEVFEASSESAVVHFEANKLKQLENRQSTTVALRIVRDGRIGMDQHGHLLLHQIQHLAQRPVHVHGADQQQLLIGATFAVLNRIQTSRLTVPQPKVIQHAQVVALNLRQRIPPCRLAKRLEDRARLGNLFKIEAIAGQLAVLTRQQGAQFQPLRILVGGWDFAEELG